jgi:hypothetical protein
MVIWTLIFSYEQSHALDQDHDDQATLYTYAALSVVLNKKCCGSNTTVYPPCVPGAQSCISQAIREKYCPI